MEVEKPAEQLPQQYRLDDLLTEHFGFAPKAFTGHAFDLINDAVFDTVTTVEEAANARYPTQPDSVQLGLHKLETLLCSAVDKHFDLFEIWLHRNVFDFKPAFKSQNGLQHVQLAHQRLWTESNGRLPRGQEWAKGKQDEASTWAALAEKKAEWTRARDEHLSLLALSAALDRRAGALQAARDELGGLAAAAAKAGPASNLSNLPDRVHLLTAQVDQLLDAHETLKAADQDTAAADEGLLAGGKMRRKEGFVNWAAARKVDSVQDAERSAAAATSARSKREPDRDLGRAKAEMEGIGMEEGAKDALKLL